MSAVARVAPWMQTLDVEDLLVWTYRHQRADIVVDRGLGMHDEERIADRQLVIGSSSCGCVAVGRIQQLGVRVDGTGGCDALHGDAETVHQVVMRLARPLQSLIIRHARDRSRPEIMARVPVRALPVIGGKGVPRVRYEPWDRNRDYGSCPIHWTVSLAAIEAERVEYSLWHGAMQRVAATLRVEGRLERHAVTGPVTIARPWTTETLDFPQEA